MNIEQIIKLVDAGYSRTEIEELMKETPSDDANQNVENEQPNVEKESKNDDASNQNVDFHQSIQKMVDEFKNGLADIKKEIQSSNLKGATIDLNDEKPEDILASIINPSYKKEK